jgi:TP901 family phage tail tape measure protein
MAKNREVKITVKFDGKGAVKGTARVESGMKNLKGETEKASKSFSGARKRLASLSTLAKGAAAAAIGTALYKSFQKMIAAGSRFQSGLADIQAITGLSGKSLNGLGDAALDASVKYGESAENILEAQKIVASKIAVRVDLASKKGAEALKQTTDAALKLATASNIDLKTAVNATTTALNQFNIPATEADRVINLIAADAKFGAVEARGQAAAYKEAGSVFAQANSSLRELGAGVQILGTNSIEGSQAGRMLKNIMLQLETSGKQLAKYGIHNINVEQDGFIKTMQKLTPLLGHSNEMLKIFQRENLSAAQILIKHADSMQNMYEKTKDTNVATQQAAVQMDTFKKAEEQLSAAINKNLIEAFKGVDGIGVKFIHTLTGMVHGVGSVVQTISGWMQVPVSDKIQQQRIKLNGLVDELASANTGEKRRKELIQKIQKIYPNFFDNLDTEKLKNDQLYDTLTDVNKAYNLRITMQKLSEDHAQAEKRLGQARAESVKSEANLWQQLSKTVQNNDFLSPQLIQVNSVEKAFQNLKSAIIDYGKQTGKTFHTIAKLPGAAHLRFQNAQRSLKEATDNLSESEKQQQQRMNVLLKMYPNAAKTIKKYFGAQENALKLLKAQRKAIKQHIASLKSQKMAAKAAGLQAKQYDSQLLALTSKLAGVNKKIQENTEKTNQNTQAKKKNQNASGGTSSSTPVPTGNTVTTTSLPSSGTKVSTTSGSSSLGIAKKGLPGQHTSKKIQLEKKLHNLRMQYHQAESVAQAKKLRSQYLATQSQIKQIQTTKRQHAAQKEFQKQLGRSIQLAIANSDSVEEASKKIVKSLVAQIISKYVSAALSTALGSGPAAFIVAPALTAAAVAAGEALMKPILNSFHSGGVLEGPSHARGGIAITRRSRPVAEAEGDEAIINRRSTRLFYDELSAINQAGGGKKFPGAATFAGGGVLSGRDTSNLSRMMVRQQLNTEMLAAAIRDGLSRAHLTAPVELNDFDESIGEYRRQEDSIGNEVN